MSSTAPLMTSSRLPTREELAAARQVSFDSIKAIIDGRSKHDDDDGDDDAADNSAGESDHDNEFENGDRARLEALLIQSRPK